MPDARLAIYWDHPEPRPEEQQAFRRILHDTPLTEEFKWKAPCYTWQGGNVAMIGGFAGRAVVSFFKGALLDDPAGLLVPPGPHSRAARMLAVTSAAEIPALEPALRDFVDQAIALERAGARLDLPDDDLDLPAELLEALDSDPDLAAAWAALTPGRRRGYVVHVAGAKQPATRAARIEKHRLRILAGLGMHDR